MSVTFRTVSGRSSVGPVPRSRLLVLIAMLGLLPGVGTPTLSAQGAQSPPFRFGAIFGANFNSVSLDQDGVDAYDFFGPRGWDDNAGSGTSPYIGGFFSYVPGTFGFHARAAFNGLGATFVETTPADISTDVAYFSLAPALRISQKKAGLHFLVGPSFDFEVSNSIRFPNPTDPASSNDLIVSDLKANMISLFGGVGYDIVLGEELDQGKSTAWILTPFLEIQHAPEQSGNADRDWSTTTVRGGVRIAYAYDSDPNATTGERPRSGGDTPLGDPPPPVASGGAGIDLDVQTPGTMLDGTRNVDEFFPLLNYLFFPPSSANLPESYRLLTPRDASTFSERRLMEAGPSAGIERQQNRAARQLRVYDNVLNVVGARMRENPGTSIELVGADPNLAVATERAEGIRSYLVSTFRIDPSRITARGVVRPPHASGTRSTPRQDLGFITEENRRVEILSDNKVLLRPVRINSTEDNLLENDILFRLNLTSSASVSSWDLMVEGVDTDFRQAYGPFYGGIARINSTPLPTTGGGRFRATATGVTFDGDTISAGEEFSLGRGGTEAGAATRFSILFEYDDSRSVQTYEEFLRKDVAPRIPDGSTVFVFGHTDLTGTEEYNRQLSARRSSETEAILGDALKRLGRRAGFDTYGFGETPFRAPFGNASPEERYYNRTVVIEIVPPAP